MVLTKQQIWLVASYLTLTLMLWGCATTVGQGASIPTGSITPTHLPTGGAASPVPDDTVTPSPTVPATPTTIPTIAPSPTLPPVVADTPSPEPINKVKNVVIISVDGLRPDALEIADTPTLDALRAAGAYSPNAQAVLPSVTLVNHASMLSGLSPAQHGIDWNTDAPERGKIQGTTLFGVAKQAGLSTVMVVGKPKLDHINQPGTVDNFVYAGFTDIQVAKQAITIIQEDMPEVLFIHLPDVDSAGHMTGWMSPGQLLAIEFTDGLIGDIVAALNDGDHLKETVVIISADHGGSETSHGSDSPEDTTIPWLAVGANVPAGIILNEDISIMDTAATAAYALGLPIPDEWNGKPILELFK
jgi:predicted AlkP superfamily pyrophosphatase or phosphodiesterase